MDKQSFGSLCENCQEDVKKDFCTKCNRFVCLNRKCLREHNGHYIIYFETIVQHHSSIQLHEFFNNSIESLKGLQVKMNESIESSLKEINLQLQIIDAGNQEFEKNANDQKLSDQTLQLINQASSTPCFKAEFSKLAEDYNQKEQTIKSHITKQLTTQVEEYMCNVSNPLISSENKFVHYAVSDSNLLYLYYPIPKKLIKVTLKEHLPTDFDSCEMNGNIYFVGGYRVNTPIADNSMLKYESTSLVPREPMHIAKYYHTLCRFGNKYIYSVGGYDYSKSIDDCERYSVVENAWIKLPNLLRPTNEPAACIFKDRYLYSICGYDSVMSLYLDLVQKLDITKNDKWEKIVMSLPSRLGAYAVAIDESSILLFGGYNGTYYNNSVIININEEDKHTCGSMHSLTVSGEYFYKSSSVMVIQKKIYAISSNQNLFTFHSPEKKWSCMLKKEWQSM